MLGCFLYSTLYRCLSERVAFPLCYLLYIASLVLYYLNKQSSIASIVGPLCSSSLARSLQGLCFGVLVPWTLHVKFDLSTSFSRFQLSFLTFVTIEGCHFMGYLLRLVGGALEIKLYCWFTGVLCLLGCLTAFSVITPSRLLYHQHRALTQNKAQNEAPLLNDDMISILSQTLEAYFLQDHEYVLDSLLLLFSLEASDFDSPGKHFKSALRTSWLIWLFSLLAFSVWLESFL